MPNVSKTLTNGIICIYCILNFDPYAWVAIRMIISRISRVRHVQNPYQSCLSHDHHIYSVETLNKLWLNVERHLSFLLINEPRCRCPYLT